MDPADVGWLAQVKVVETKFLRCVMVAFLSGSAARRLAAIQRSRDELSPSRRAPFRDRLLEVTVEGPLWRLSECDVLQPAAAPTRADCSSASDCSQSAANASHPALWNAHLVLRILLEGRRFRPHLHHHGSMVAPEL